MNKECAICGAKEKIHTHHIDGDRNNNSEDNLINVCSSCHRKIHGDENLPHLKDEKILELKNKLPNVDSFKIKCNHCNYDWESKSISKKVTCPSCNRKTDRISPTNDE